MGSGMDKGLIWIELKDGFAEPGCAICNILAQGTRRYFSFFLHESVTSPDERLRLIESAGWCARHTLLFLAIESREWPDHMSYGIIAESLLEAERNSLSKARDMLTREAKKTDSRGWSKARRRVVEQVRARLGCPVCEMEDERKTSYLGFFLDALFDSQLGPEMEELHRNSHGLCHRHLVGCLARCGKPEQALRLLALEMPKIEALIVELEDYVRKHEHRYRKEKFGAELDAWARTARKLAGHQALGEQLEKLVEQTRQQETR